MYISASGLLITILNTRTITFWLTNYQLHSISSKIVFNSNQLQLSITPGLAISPSDFLLTTLCCTLRTLPCRSVGGLITLCPSYCYVVEDGAGLCGYIVATHDVKEYQEKWAQEWLPLMQRKYPKPKTDNKDEMTASQVHFSFKNPLFREQA